MVVTTIIYSVSYIQKNQSCMFKQIICDREHDEVCYVHDSYLKKNFVASVRKRATSLYFVIV